MTRLLIIRFSALGDVAMLAPVVRAVAEQYPELSITMLSQQRMADLFVNMPQNVTFHGVDLKKQSLRTIVSGLDAYDVVADMHSVIRSIYIRTMLMLKGARVASIDKGRRSKRQLTREGARTPLQHTTGRYADVLAQLGFPIQLPEASMTEGQGIGIAPFAAHAGKIYPIEKMERVVELLSKEGIEIILFGGGKKEQEILGVWEKKYPHVTSIAGRLPLREELAAIRGLRLMVTMDSANMHLASLVGTRVLSIWGATHPYAGFLGYGQKESDCIQRDLPCRPCSIYGNKQCQYGDYRCLEIVPEGIVKKILSSYEGRD